LLGLCADSSELRSCGDLQQLKVSFATSKEFGRSRTEGDALD
jgi:hypothetical protein